MHEQIRTVVRRGILSNDRGELAIDCRSIGDYPRDHLMKMLTAGMCNTWWDREELITSTARYLGFARTGPAIRDALKSIINGAIRKGLLESDGPRVRKV